MLDRDASKAGAPAVLRVELRRISKEFPGVVALSDVGLRLHAGEVHALMGENGAGKSTLIKIMTGALARDSGEIRVDGKPVEIDSPATARALGISTVYQEINLVPTLSVIKNLTLERQPMRYGMISWREAARRGRTRLARLNLDIDLERPLGSYSVAVQQLIAIARALEDDTCVLVLDEPTASLDPREVELLFGILRRLKSNGIAIVFITHFIDQVYQIADRISVLRNGREVGTARTLDLPRLRLISMMLGRELQQAEQRQVTISERTADPPVLAVRGMGRRRYMGRFDLALHAGEVVGLAGLLGSGRTEVSKIAFGAVRPDEGHFEIDGRRVAIRSPRGAILLGIGFCPEDRKAEGLIGELSVRENIALALQTKRGWLRRLPRAEQERLAREMVAALGIATPHAEKPAGQLSGGNQQKVILARWLVSRPRVLILDEPTRGIDVGAHAEVLGLIRRLCREGLALLVASSELEEIVAISDRVVVLRDRHKVGEIAGAEITRDTVIRTIAGG
jgi:galactofuranose transport system ATP-binding protein